MKALGIKYCGGCRSLFDRSIASKLLECENVSIAQSGKHYDTVAVICGCPSCCADVSSLSADSFLFLYDRQQIMSLYDELKSGGNCRAKEKPLRGVF